MAESLQPTQFESKVIKETAVDYSAFSKSFSDAIESGLATRDSMLTDINKTQDAFNETVQKNAELTAASGDMLVPRVTKAMEEGSLMLQEANNLYRRGNMTRDQWLNKTNKINNSATQMKAFITEFNTQYEEAMTRQKAGTLEGSKVLSQGSTLDAYNMEGLGALAQMVDHGFQFTTNGDLLFAKFDKNGNPSKRVGDYRTLPGSLSAVVQKYDNVDMNSVYDTTADGLGVFLKADVKGRFIKTMSDVRQNEEAMAYINAEWETVSNNDDSILSLITDQGVPPPDGTQWGFTEDKAEADANKNLILVEAGQDGRLNPIRDHQNFKDASEKAKTTFENGVGSRLGLKETITERRAPAQMQEWQYKRGLLKKQKRNNLDLINKLFSSSESGYKEASKALQNFVVITGEGGDKKEVKLTELERGKDGIVRMVKEVVSLDENGNKKKPEYIRDEIDMSGINNRQFMNSYFAFMYGESPDQSTVNSYNMVENFGTASEDVKSKTTKIQSKPYSDLPLMKFGSDEISPSRVFKKPIEEDNINTVIDAYSSLVSGGLDADLNFTGYEYVPDGQVDDEGVSIPAGVSFGYKGNNYIFPLTETDGEFKIQGGNFEALYKQMAQGDELKGNYVNKL